MRTWILAPVVLLLSFVWSSINAVRRFAWARGFLSEDVLGPRVISVGNLQAGGTGKTPIVAHIAREAITRGKKVLILLRGYRGGWERTGGVLEPGRLLAPAEVAQAGDEGVLLHDLVPGAWIGIGADRVAVYKRVVAQSGIPDLVLLDDGFQNIRIHRDVDVVLWTEARPWQKVFRDFSHAARGVRLKVWSKGELRISRQAQLGKRLIRVEFVLKAPAPSQAPLWLVAGVGEPLRVQHAAEKAGFRVERLLAPGDHAWYARAQVQRWLGEATQAGCRVAVTGKDWVKWRALGVSPAEVLVLEPEVHVVEGKELWDRVLWAR